MKKVIMLIMSMMMIMSYQEVKAECNNEELNEWATKVEASFTQTDKESSDEYGYAYFLSITPMREDIKIKVYDKDGNSEEGKTFESINLYGVGCYTNLESETYKIEVYGKEGSACEGELLKTITYTVPRLNRMIKNDVCERYPDHELCQTFSDKTKDMSEEEFLKEMKAYEESIKEESVITKIIKNILGYSMFVIIPIIVIAVIYETKIKKVRKEKRMK